ncbi:MAG: Unknown protein [uncultured Sulfurovum sp.]|uniref:Uncharacterized protein n=1 Tax=uncultured Sulfurovum sp. TaxID=269237 RepID=A0A6S6TZC8_9BACT|nr:MAG: Unknown protein [uncultured Sulfurovum sp.]
MNGLTESLINYLLKKNIVKFSKIEESFFLYKRLEKKVRLSSEIIQINYLKESPYTMSESSISSILVDKNLYLWFTRGEERALPEALLLYRSLELKYNSVFCIIRGDVDKTVLIKDKVLVSSFSKKNISKVDIHLIKEEYRIADVLILEHKEYEELLESSYKNLKFSDVFDILKIQIDFKQTWTKLVTWLALPLLVTSVTLVLALGAYLYYLDDNKTDLHGLYKKSRVLSNDIKTSIDNSENENMQYNLLADELKYHEKTLAISNIIRVTQEMNMSMHYIKVYANKVDFVLRTDNQELIPVYIKKLFASQYFLDVKNISSFKRQDKQAQITMIAVLREK